MAGQHYGPSMYSSHMSHRLSAIDAAHVNRQSSRSSTTSDAYAARHEMYDLRPPPPPPPPLPQPMQPAILYENAPTEPSAKRRRVDEGPSSLRFVSQKKWTFADSQPWTTAYPTTSPKSASIENIHNLGETITRPHQLPTPQTPRFPQHVTQRPELARAVSAEHVSSKTQPSRSEVERANSARSFSALPIDMLADMPRLSHTHDGLHQPWQSDFVPISNPDHSANEPLNVETIPAPLVSAPTTSKTPTTKLETKSKFSQQTLSLEKDADQIAALIATKRKENEANLFRQRLLQRQREHQNLKSSKNSGTEYGSETSSSPRLGTSSTPTLNTTQHESRGMHFPMQSSSTSLQYAATTSHNTTLAVQQPSPAFQGQHSLGQQLPKTVESAVNLGQGSSSINRMLVNNHATFPSPPSIYSSTVTNTPRESEFRDPTTGHIKSPNAAIENFPLSPNSEFRPSPRMIRHQYSAGDKLNYSTDSSRVTHTAVVPRVKRGTRSRSMVRVRGRPARKVSTATPDDYSHPYNVDASGQPPLSGRSDDSRRPSVVFTAPPNQDQATSSSLVPLTQPLQASKITQRQNSSGTLRSTTHLPTPTIPSGSQAPLASTGDAVEIMDNPGIVPGTNFVYTAANPNYNMYADGDRGPWTMWGPH